MAALLFLPIFLILFWVLIFLPQRRMRQAHDAVVASLEPGCLVMTTAGLYASVRSVDSDTAMLEIADGVVIKVDKQSVAVVLTGDADPDGDVRGEGPASIEGGSAADLNAPGAGEGPVGR